MASNYSRKSGASDLRKKQTTRSRTGSTSSRSTRRQPAQAPRKPVSIARQPSANQRARQQQNASRPRSTSSARYVQDSSHLTSVRLGDLNQSTRAHRVQRSYRQYVVRIAIALVLMIALLAAGITIYNSSLFTITNVSVQGVEHLTATEMTELASVPAGTTLLRVDETGIKDRLSKEAWVKDVEVKRIFPDTLELVITERTIAAVVEVPANKAETTETWAIASGGIWLMHIPPKNSEEAQSISVKVYEDAASVLRITGVPYGLTPEVGVTCSDENVNNALAIVDGLTTELADQVQTVSATGTETTTLILENGIEIAFGTAENIRDKERVCLQLMAEYPGQITYINVRIVDNPTWRSTES